MFLSFLFFFGKCLLASIFSLSEKGKIPERSSLTLSDTVPVSDVVVFVAVAVAVASLLWSMTILESVKLLSTLTFSCCAGTEKEKSVDAAVAGAAGAGAGGGVAGAAGFGADEDVAPNLARPGTGDGEDAAKGEDLEESSGPGSVAEAAAESLFLCWKLAARSLSRWVFLGDFFFGIEVFLGCEFRRHLGFSCLSSG